MIPSLRISFSYFLIFSCLISKERDKLLTNKLLGITLFFAVTQPHFWILSSYNTCTRLINAISGISISVLSAENQRIFFSIQFTTSIRQYFRHCTNCYQLEIVLISMIYSNRYFIWPQLNFWTGWRSSFFVSLKSIIHQYVVFRTNKFLDYDNWKKNIASELKAFSFI